MDGRAPRIAIDAIKLALRKAIQESTSRCENLSGKWSLDATVTDAGRWTQLVTAEFVSTVARRFN